MCCTASHWEAIECPPAKLQGSVISNSWVGDDFLVAHNFEV